MTNTIANSEHIIEKAAKDLLVLVREIGDELHLPRADVDGLGLDSSFHDDLRLDSLTQLEFFSRVEKHFGVSLPEKAFTHISTPRSLLEYILTAEKLDHSEIVASIGRLMPAPAGKMPRRPKTLLDVLDWHAEKNPDRPHITFCSDSAAGETVTYSALKQHAEKLAGGLVKQGLRSKETVVILLPSGKEYVVSFFAVLLAGGIPVPLPPPTRHQQLKNHLVQYRNVFSNCRAKFLITDAPTKASVADYRIGFEFIRTLLTPDDLAADTGRLIRPMRSSHDIAYLQYTPGGTGEPKSVILTHANLLANIRAAGEWSRLSSQDVFMNWLPLHHNMGLVGSWLSSLFYAFMLVNAPPLFFLIKPERWLWAIHRFRATITAAPDFAYAVCLQRIGDEDIRGLDLSLLRIAFNGAEPVRSDAVEKFCERFARYGFRTTAMTPVFGLAENAFALTLPPINRGLRIDHIQRNAFMRTGRAIPVADRNHALRLVSLGQALAGHEIRVIDPLGSELPERRLGRLEFRGPSATAGYYGNPEETRRLYDGKWVDSGDSAYIADGELYVLGRAEELIRHRGRNFHPLELAQAINRLPGIVNGSVAVFSTRPRRAAHRRLIVLAGTREQDDANLAAMRSRIEDTARALIGAAPDDIVFALPDVIPKTSMGLVKYGAIRELYEKQLRDEAGQPAARHTLRSYLLDALGRLRPWAGVISSRLYGAYFWAAAIPIVIAAYCFFMSCPIASWRWRFARRAAKTLFAVTGIPIAVQGKENLPPNRQPCIFVCNHSSYLDGFILMSALPTRLSFVAKAALSRRFFSRTFLSRLDTVFVNRFDKERGIRDATNIVHLAAGGKSFLFFPEGTFTRKSGLRPFHLGAFVTACDTGLPIVPVVIHGARSLLRDETWLPRHVSVSVTIGKPIDPDRFILNCGRTDRLSAILALRDTVREQMLKEVREPDLS
jgi:acyl carrier protein